MDFNIAAGFYLVTGGAISSLVLLVGHYFPWHKLLGTELSRLWSYRYGSAACWIGFSYWRYFGLADYVTPIGLMIIYIASGTTVWLAYVIDAEGQKLTIANRRRQHPSGYSQGSSDEYPIMTEDISK